MKLQQNNNRDAGLALLLIILLTTYFTQNISFIIPAVVVLILIMTVPSIFQPFAVLWFGLSKHLGSVSSRIILTLLFFILIVPVGFLRRKLGKDPLKLKEWKKSTSSSFMERNHKYSKSDMASPF